MMNWLFILSGFAGGFMAGVAADIYRWLRKPKVTATNTGDYIYLQWIYERLIEVHGEKAGYDYMIKLREIIDRH